MIPWSALATEREKVRRRWPAVFDLPVVRRRFPFLAGHLKDGARLLEVGAAERPFDDRLKASFPKLVHRTLDIDPAGGHDFHSLDEITAGKETFDLVVAWEVIEHLPLEEIPGWLGLKVTAPGGRLSSPPQRLPLRPVLEGPDPPDPHRLHGPGRPPADGRLRAGVHAPDLHRLDVPVPHGPRIPPRAFPPPLAPGLCPVRGCRRQIPMKLGALIQGFEVPSSRYRVLQYFPHLEKSGFSCEARPFPASLWGWGKTLRWIRGLDLLILHRKRPSALRLMQIRRAAKRIVYDVDDASYRDTRPRATRNPGRRALRGDGEGGHWWSSGTATLSPRAEHTDRVRPHGHRPWRRARAGRPGAPLSWAGSGNTGSVPIWRPGGLFEAIGKAPTSCWVSPGFRV